MICPRCNRNHLGPKGTNAVSILNLRVEICGDCKDDETVILCGHKIPTREHINFVKKIEQGKCA